MLPEKRRRLDPDDTLKLFLAIIVSIHKQWHKLNSDYIEDILKRMVSLANEKLHEVSEELKPACLALKSLSIRDIMVLDRHNARHRLQDFLKKFFLPAPYNTGISIRMIMNIPREIRKVIKPVRDILLEGAPVSGIDGIDTYVHCTHRKRRETLPAGINIFNPEPLQEARKRPPVGTSRERLPMYDEPLPLIRGCYPDKTEVPDKLRFLREEKGLPFIKPRRQS